MGEPIPEHKVADLLEDRLGGSPWNVVLVAQGSNDVYRCAGPSGPVAVRVPRVDEGEPSPFWGQMRTLFSSTFPPSAEQHEAVTAALGAAGLTAPRLLGAPKLDGRTVLVTTWIAGDRWEPDRFPAVPEIHRMLGRFLAMMHVRKYPGYGAVGGPLKPAGNYCEAAVTSAGVAAATTRHRQGQRLLSVMAAADPADVAGSCALVMPDISANQFLFGEARIAGVVDLDAYVIGPVELELTIAEWCLTDHGSFADGYRSIRALPRFASFRAFHRASMLVNEPAVEDVDRLLTENAVFD